MQAPDVAARSMDQEITYDWSEELGRSAMTAAMSATQWRPALMFFAGAFLVVLALFEWFSGAGQVFWLYGFFGVFLMGMVLQAKRNIRMTAREFSALREGGAVNVRLTDERMVVLVDRDVSTFAWGKVSRFHEQDGFILLFAGKLLLACLPKKPFSVSQIDFIRSRVNGA